MGSLDEPVHKYELLLPPKLSPIRCNLYFLGVLNKYAHLLNLRFFLSFERRPRYLQHQNEVLGKSFIITHSVEISEFSPSQILREIIFGHLEPVGLTILKYIIAVYVYQNCTYLEFKNEFT